MANHIHLLMTPETEYGLSQLMQSLVRYYVRYINQTYDKKVLCGKSDTSQR